MPLKLETQESEGRLESTDEMNGWIIWVQNVDENPWLPGHVGYLIQYDLPIFTVNLKHIFCNNVK
jgi:hypothetical protein